MSIWELKLSFQMVFYIYLIYLKFYIVEDFKLICRIVKCVRIGYQIMYSWWEIGKNK